MRSNSILDKSVILRQPLLKAEYIGIPLPADILPQICKTQGEYKYGQCYISGQELQLEGPLPKVGDNAPDFVLTSNSLEPVTLKDFTGKTIAIVTVPSLDTPVCDVEARHFNEEAAKLSDNVRIVVVSTRPALCRRPGGAARPISGMSRRFRTIWKGFRQKIRRCNRKTRPPGAGYFVVRCKGHSDIRAACAGSNPRT